MVPWSRIMAYGAADATARRAHGLPLTRGAVPVRARSGRGLIMGSQQSTVSVLSRQQMDALIDGHFRAAVSHRPQAGRWQSLVLIGLRTTMLRESRPALAFTLREGGTNHGQF